MSQKYLNKYRIQSTHAPWWDYDKNGIYFVTICTAGRTHYFGNIKPVGTLHVTSLIPTEIGKMAHQFWLEIPSHFPFVVLDEFVVMPNHIHGIIVIDHNRDLDDRCFADVADVVETLHATSLPENPENPEKQQPPKNQKMADLSPKTGSLSSIIRSYKSAVTHWCTKNEYSFGWQSRFHDHIIQNDDELIRIRKYIVDNPAKWNEDALFN